MHQQLSGSSYKQLNAEPSTLPLNSAQLICLDIRNARRAGWLEDQPSRVTGRMEIRPAAEQGPIIVCLDTSGEYVRHDAGRTK